MVKIKEQLSDRLTDTPLIKKACEFSANAKQGLETAEILLDLKLDEASAIASIILSGRDQTPIALETVSQEFGEEVASLVGNVLQMKPIDTLSNKARDQTQTDRLRKILLVMAKDIRVVLIKLAERVSLMRSIKHLHAEARKPLAQETMDLYAPLANRLGIGQIKWELEDLAFHYLNPTTYKTIANYLSEKRIDRDKRIKNIVQEIKNRLPNAEVTGRAKHIYSIYLKKQKKNLDYSDIYDYSAVRILVPSIEDCYTALSIVHSLWEPISNEFDDYIAHPKANGYRSIHTAVIGPEDKTLEIQIRTHDMHNEAEHGVAAHWIYKETHQKLNYEDKITYLRQLLAWQQDISPTKQTGKSTAEIFSDRVYVFTPLGDIIEMPYGATPLDFAYHLHSDLGHRTRGAKIKGHIVSLKYILQTGDQIEILTTANGTPSRDWLNPDYGYLKTSRARAKVAQWFRQLDQPKPVAPTKPETAAPTLLPIAKKSASSPKSLTIEGIDDLLTRIAKCCKPIPGEAIIGYITQGRGISIHSKECRNISHRLQNLENRLIQVSWDSKKIGRYYADLFIKAEGHSNIMKEMTNLITLMKITLISFNSTLNQKTNMINITVTVEIQDSDQLKQLISKIKQLHSIIEVKRISE